MRRRALALLLLLLLTAFGCGRKAEAGSTIAITVTVVHGDGSEKNFSLETNADNLGDALMDAHVVRGEQGSYGLFITTADEETADETKEQWWCLTKDGASVETGADQTPIADGDAFELTLATGY